MFLRLWLPLCLAVLLAPAAFAVAEEAGEGPAAANSSGVSDEERAAFPIVIDPELAIFTAIEFLLVLAILGKFAWNPIVEALDKREEEIAGQIKSAEESNQEAKRLLGEYEQKLQAASVEVQEMIARARQDAEVQASKIVSEANAAAANERDRSLKAIEAAKNSALRELADKTVDTAVGLARQVIQTNISPDDRRRLLDDALQQFPSNN